jgi:hypothetical protein
MGGSTCLVCSNRAIALLIKPESIIVWQALMDGGGMKADPPIGLFCIVSREPATVPVERYRMLRRIGVMCDLVNCLIDALSETLITRRTVGDGGAGPSLRPPTGVVAK